MDTQNTTSNLLAAVSASIHAFLEFLLPVFPTIFFPSHWLLSHIPIVETMVSDCVEEQGWYWLALLGVMTAFSIFTVGFGVFKIYKIVRPRHTRVDDREDLTDELERVKSERDNAIHRLSEAMSAKLRDGNPNIEDLCDENRPTKLGERLSELYDNEYTDATSLLLHNRYTETEAVRILLDILRFAYESCAEASRRQLALIHQLIILPMTGPTDLNTNSHDEQMLKVLPVEFLKRIKDERKAVKPELSLILNQVMAQIKKHYNDVPILDRRPITTYVNQCTQLVWLMTIQDPPMYLEFNEARLENLRAYTQSGPVLDFHVWPSLSLYKGGPIMVKGVAQFRLEHCP